MGSLNEIFAAGEKVMYPQFGLGTVAGVTEKQVNGSNLSFYRLEFPLKQMEILVPVRRATENGLRRVMDESEADEVLEYLSCSPPTPRPQQWHRWRKRTLEQLKTGDPLDIAKIFCYLNSLDGKKGLSFTERKILTQVERMLISEVGVALGIDDDAAGKLILARRDVEASSNGKSNGHGSNGHNANGDNGHAPNGGGHNGHGSNGIGSDD